MPRASTVSRRTRRVAASPRSSSGSDFRWPRATEPMEDLSRGMQQKIALARALLTSPVLLLLDEPTTGLDPRSKREVQDFVASIRQTTDVTILLCTHDMAEAETMADRVGILHHGRLLCLDTPAEIIDRYGGGSLEQAFLEATGTSFEDEGDPLEEVVTK